MKRDRKEWDQLEIRKAKTSEQNEIFQIYIDAIQHMEHQGIHQWDSNYPNRELLLSDLEDEEVHILVDEGQYVGVIVLNEYQDEEWGVADWRYTEGPVLVIHRLAVHPSAQGRGFAKKLLQFAEDFAAENGYRQIRLDTYSGNPTAVKLYESFGYEHRGEVFFTRELPFYCMEKRVDGGTCCTADERLRAST